MIYLSQLLHVPIIDNRQEVIGKIKDLIAEADHNGYPAIKGIIFEKAKELCFIPFSCIENMSRAEVTLKKSDCWKINYQLHSSDIALLKDILDKQIFDVQGIRVVRVNDIQLSKIDNKFFAVGIDISNKALYRRLGFGNWPFFQSRQSQYIDWHNISFIKGDKKGLTLKTSLNKIKKLHPADIANLIENLSHHESSKFVQDIDKETAAEVLSEVEPEYKDTLLEKINSKNLAGILEEMPTDEAADVIQDLSEHKRLQVYRRLGVKKAKTLHKLSKYEEDKAGGLMSQEFIKVFEDDTVASAIRLIKEKSGEHDTVYHLYVVNENQKLTGIVSIRTLLISSGRKKIKEVMSKVAHTLRPHTHAIDIARIMTKYNLLSIAVVDKQRKIQGIVTVDDIMRFLVPEA